MKIKTVHEEFLIISKARQGDRKAFRELYERNMPGLLRFMRQFSSDVHEAEEWVQRAFIKSFENLSGFNGMSKYSTWLFRIAVNEMKMDLRKAGRFKYISAEDEEPAQLPDNDFQWDMLMKEWLPELSDVKRMVFILYEVEGYSHAEIASMLDIGESTSRTILARVKAWLKLKWKESESGK